MMMKGWRLTVLCIAGYCFQMHAMDSSELRVQENSIPPKACFNLGLRYFNGEVCDYEQAGKCFEAVIENNPDSELSAWSCIYLTRIYSLGGYGVKKDESLRKQYLEFACNYAEEKEHAGMSEIVSTLAMAL